MRRLPIYFLIDVSESMIGEPIQQVEEGLAMIVKELKTDPYALETVYISIIVFAGKSKTLIPLQELVAFYPPRFPVGSGTSLSNALGHLMFELQSNTVRTSYETKGDWKPIIFLFTDGVPTNDTKSAIEEWKNSWKKSTHMVAISFGNGADCTMLGELSDHVLNFENTNNQSYKEFFKWVTASIKTNSVSVENNTERFELAKLNGDTISRIDLAKGMNNPSFTDDNYVVLNGKCQQSKRPYLMKYKKNIAPSNLKDLNLSIKSYRLIGAYQVDNSYYELAEEDYSNSKISTEELFGVPNCPCCGNQFAFAVCICGQIHCIDYQEINTCPWCENKGSYGTGESGININRTKG